jgi:predicted 3-demethylubiquinone-9 3-methyltransferase (glyoxalase superfamily)
LRIETKFWDALTDGGEEGLRGWLKDRYGVSWQIVPKVLYELIGDPDREKSQRVMAAMLKMKKIEIAELERAAAAA